MLILSCFFHIEIMLLSLFEDLTSKFVVLAKDIEDDLFLLNESIKQQDAIVHDELDANYSKLDEIGALLNKLKTNYDVASKGALTVGEKLNHSETERRRIVSAIKWMDYVKIFQSIPATSFDGLHAMAATQIRTLLPPSLVNMDWGEISKILFELRRVLSDINSDDVQIAQKNVIRLTEAIETELLGEFEVAVLELMENPTVEAHMTRTKELCKWLHLYNNGQSVQNRYLFTVIEKRIPRKKFVQNTATIATKSSGNFLSALGIVSKSSLNEKKKRKSKVVPGKKSLFGRFASAEQVEGESSSEGESDGEVEEKNNEKKSVIMRQSVAEKAVAAEGSSDNLSELFGHINIVCSEQFTIIRAIFPPAVVAAITRILIQRIFTDPAFGIQTLVDNILSPAPPKPQLNLSSYLDALTIVREKLSALYVVLLEHCSHPSMHGMGRELVRGFGGKVGINRSPSNDSLSNPVSSELLDNLGGSKAASSAAEELQRLQSDNEIKAFLDEQVSSVIGTYITDYFDKELTLVKFEFSDNLKRAVGNDSSYITAVSVLSSQPRLKAEKFKSISELVSKVANVQYINSVFMITTESILRMERIGRDDKRLALKAKELYLLEIEFLVDGLFIPWSTSIVTLLLKCASTSANKSAMPPLEFLQALSALFMGINKIKSHFEDIYVVPLTLQPQLIVICKEARTAAFKRLDKVMKESIFAWSMCVGIHLEKTLTTLQSKYDFAPQGMTVGGRQMSNKARVYTDTCAAIRKELITLENGVSMFKEFLQGFNMVELLWKPLGQMFVGTLISHIKKYKVSIDGAKILLNDLEEYKNLCAIMEYPEVIDMMLCLKEIATVFLVPSEKVEKKVVEDLRQLDTHVILAFVRNRADAATRPGELWMKGLNSFYGTLRWDAPLPWEGKNRSSILGFNELVSNKVPLGPSTLRKTQTPLSQALIIEAAKALEESLSKNTVGLTVGAGNSMPTVTSASASAKNTGGLSNNIENAFNRFSAQFVPSRDGNRESKKLFDIQLSTPSLSFISRPDLIGNNAKEAFGNIQKGFDALFFSNDSNTTNNVPSKAPVVKTAAVSTGATTVPDSTAPPGPLTAPAATSKPIPNSKHTTKNAAAAADGDLFAEFIKPNISLPNPFTLFKK